MKQVQEKDYLKISQEFYHLQNKVRGNPLYLIPDLENRALNFNNRVLTLPNGKQIKTKEGQKAVEECITFLKKQLTLQPLDLDNKLSLAAKDHSLDIGLKGIITHLGSDGSTLKQRVEKYGKWKNLLGENMSFAVYDPKEILLQLIIDDGVQGRGHRNNVFTAAFTVVGIYFQYHLKYHICGVIDYAGQFFEHDIEILQDPDSAQKSPIFSIPHSPPSEKISFQFPTEQSQQKESEIKKNNEVDQDFQSIKSIQSYKETGSIKDKDQQESNHKRTLSQTKPQESKLQQIMSLDFNNLVKKKTPPSKKQPTPTSEKVQILDVHSPLSQEGINNLTQDESKGVKRPKQKIQFPIQPVNLNFSEGSSKKSPLFYQTQSPEVIQKPIVLKVTPQQNTFDRFQSFSIPQQQQNQQLLLNGDNLFQSEQSFRQSVGILQPAQQQAQKRPIVPKLNEGECKKKKFDNMLNQFLEKRYVQPQQDNELFPNQQVPQAQTSKQNKSISMQTEISLQSSFYSENHGQLFQQIIMDDQRPPLQEDDFQLEDLINKLYSQVVDIQNKQQTQPQQRHQIKEERKPEIQRSQQVSQQLELEQKNKTLAPKGDGIIPINTSINDFKLYAKEQTPQKIPLSNPYLKSNRFNQSSPSPSPTVSDKPNLTSGRQEQLSSQSRQKVSSSKSGRNELSSKGRQNQIMEINVQSPQDTNQESNKSKRIKEKDTSQNFKTKKAQSQPQQQLQDSVKLNINNNVQIKENAVVPSSKNRTPRPLKEYPIMSMNKYLFIQDKLLGGHRFELMIKQTEEEILQYYKTFKSTGKIPLIQELIQSYQFDKYSLFLVKQNPQLFQLCQENYTVCLNGIRNEKDKSKWLKSYMPRENLIPYLRSLGFLIDQAAAENIFKLIQTYYLGPSQQQKRSILSRKSIVVNPSEKPKQLNEFNFDGVLLCIFACQELYPDPVKFRECLNTFDENKTGSLNKQYISDIICQIGEGVSEEEIKSFFNEFKDWKQFETQRLLQQNQKKKMAKSKTKQVQQDLQYKDFNLSDAVKLLTILPY